MLEMSHNHKITNREVRHKTQQTHLKNTCE